MKTKSILQITGMKCTKYGAIERYLLHTVEYCNRMGFQSFLQYESLPDPRAYIEDLEKAGAKLIVQPVSGGRLFGLPGLRSLIAGIRPTIIHSHFVSGVGTLAIPVFGHLYGTSRSICTVHNKSTDPRRWIKRTGYNLYDHVLCVSNAVRENLIVGGVKEEKLRTHYLGIFHRREISHPLRNDIRKNLGIPEYAVVLACIAFDAPFKGWDILLTALSEVAKINNNVYLITVGVNPELSELPSLSKKLGISDKVRWAGIVDDGWLLLNGADIYVQPSRSSEGLPLSIMEAMALKLPVVCTNVSGNVEAVVHGETGINVESKPDSLTKGILSMIENRWNWSSMGELGFERFNKLFDGAKSSREMVERYYLG